MKKSTTTKKNSANQPANRKGLKKGLQKLRITVYPRTEILDPQGKAIEAALARLEFKQVLEVRAGKSFEIIVRSKTAASAETLARRMCERLLANTNVETYTIEPVAAEESL